MGSHFAVPESHQATAPAFRIYNGGPNKTKLMLRYLTIDGEDTTLYLGDSSPSGADDKFPLTLLQIKRFCIYYFNECGSGIRTQFSDEAPRGHFYKSLECFWNLDPNVLYEITAIVGNL